MKSITADQRACITWNVCCEPGDEAAGLLRSLLGNELSCELLLRGNVSDIITALSRANQIDQAIQRFPGFEKTLVDSLERWRPRLSGKQVEHLEHLVRVGQLNLLIETDPLWPSAFGDLGYGAPAAIWWQGNPEALAKLDESISLVGSRSASSYGHWVTSDLVAEVVNRNHVVVSGGAYGIDAIAHRTAVAIGGITAVVLAGGIDRLYPAGNQSLFEEVRKDSILLAELPPGSSPTKWRFLQRNRLIAALGKATVVVEAGWRSGSINTANHAYNLGRFVGAVPGAISSPSSAGCHRLIQESVAQLVTGGANLFELMGESSMDSALFANSIGVLETRVKDALTARYQDEEAIAAEAGTTSHETNLALSSLLLLGIVEGGYGRWRLKGSNL